MMCFLAAFWWSFLPPTSHKSSLSENIFLFIRKEFMREVWWVFFRSRIGFLVRQKKHSQENAVGTWGAADYILLYVFNYTKQHFKEAFQIPQRVALTRVLALTSFILCSHPHLGEKQALSRNISELAIIITIQKSCSTGKRPFGVD